MLELLNETAEVFLTWSKNLFYLALQLRNSCTAFFSDKKKKKKDYKADPSHKISALILKLWHRVTS